LNAFRGLSPGGKKYEGEGGFPPDIESGRPWFPRASPQFVTTLG
jgi:hypothetical protein